MLAESVNTILCHVLVALCKLILCMPCSAADLQLKTTAISLQELFIKGMARRCLFSFATVPDGYFFSNGKSLHASAVSASLIKAINEDRLKDLNSISIDPSGGWIVCYNRAANGGPDGDNYYADGISKPLEHFLTEHAHEDRSNPVQWVKLGPDDQFFVRRRSTMAWQMSELLSLAMKKLQQLEVQGYLEEVVFGPNQNTAIFIFNNGSFLWDLPLESEEHELLQRCYAMGNHLEAAALSFMSPGDYFFFWGHGNASYNMPTANSAKVDEMIPDSCVTRMRVRMLQTLTSPGKEQPPKQPAPMSPDSVLTRAGSDAGSDVGSTDSIDAEAESRLRIMQQLSSTSLFGPRQGNGNLRTWKTLS